MKQIELLIENGIDVEKSLELFGDIETYDDSLTTFLDHIESRLEKLKKYKETSDMANYKIEVHALKSDSLYFGFQRLAKIAYEHEENSNKNDMFYIMEHYDDLEEELLRIIELVQNYFGKKVVRLEQLKNTSSLPKDQTILIVDDSIITRKFVQKIFSKNYNCLVAHDGKEDMLIISEDKEDKIVAILLDLNMPEISGFDILDYFKTNKLFSKKPVSIITGDDSKDTKEKMNSYHIVDILVKPFNERDVKIVVEKTIAFKSQLKNS